MTNLANNIVESITQCWGCGVFDNLFRIVSEAGAAVYTNIAQICLLLFAVLFGFYVLWMVFRTMNPLNKDIEKNTYRGTLVEHPIVKVIINSIVALSLLAFGVGVPRAISRITFEPVADIALVYTQATLNTTDEFVNEHVTYQPKPMEDNGLYRPELRDKIIMLMKTTITEFQAYMKLGIVVMDKAFTWKALWGIGAFIKHILIFLIGLYLLYGFGKLFIRFCFCFVDVIVAMATFAFFFPISLMLMSFKDSEMPKWMSNLGKGLGAAQIKTLVNSIVTIGATVITYTVILVIIAKFMSSGDMSTTEMMNAITSGQIFESDISYDSVMTMSFAGAVVLVYVLNYIYSNIPQVSKMILAVFNIETENKLSEQMANDVEKMMGNVVNGVKGIGEAVISHGAPKEEKGDKK